MLRAKTCMKKEIQIRVAFEKNGLTSFFSRLEEREEREDIHIDHLINFYPYQGVSRESDFVPLNRFRTLSILNFRKYVSRKDRNGQHAYYAFIVAVK